MKSLNTTGDLRVFLLEALRDVKSGKLDTQKANAMARISAQVNESLKTELMIKRHVVKSGEFNHFPLHGRADVA